ncbi:MAG: prephenate dehydrogenase/arogenate dehydrogenase family protein [Chloroflexia bacterium]|nr:prephenate dehydrogenase/arogenate dehydrogenase family protein [Chloroflexia bacterium]
MPQRVSIIGLGLIGGSIGLGLRRWSSTSPGAKGSSGGLEIVGFDADLEQQRYAKKIGAVDRTEWDLQSAIRDADIVVLATPVGAMRTVFEDISSRLKAGSVVTDTGSTKVQVLDWAKELLPTTVSFVGGHPMAGKAQSIEAAEADLFKGATWCVAPSINASDDAVRNVLGLIAALEAEAYFIDPHEHDAYVAGVSHLPFVLSAALVRTVATDPSWRDMKSLTAGGFRDMSRLAAGSPAMHRDILRTNRDAILRWIDQFQSNLQDMRTAIATESDATTPELEGFLIDARDARADWSTQTRREGELLQSTAAELAPDSIGDQMGRMLLGGLGRRRGKLNERLAAAEKGRDQRDRR